MWIYTLWHRKDTYEIFAEPVDPNEVCGPNYSLYVVDSWNSPYNSYFYVFSGKVEDYYTIVKEPMDFGTMRAKLHEGMYKTLQQFEVEVYKHC